MKIALCISGQPRSVEKGFEFYKKNLLDSYDVDVFVHTWFYDFYDYNYITKIYKPKKLKIESYLKSDLEKNIRYCRFNIYSAFYSATQSYLLAREYEEQNDFKYDWIIKTRFDFALNKKFDFETLDSDKIYVPPSTSNQVVSDQFAFGSSSVMEKYFELFNNIDEFRERGIDIGGEIYITENLKKYGFWNDKTEILDLNPPFPPGRYDCMYNSLIRDEFEFWAKV